MDFFFLKSNSLTSQDCTKEKGQTFILIQICIAQVMHNYFPEELTNNYTLQNYSCKKEYCSILLIINVIFIL